MDYYHWGHWGHFVDTPPLKDLTKHAHYPLTFAMHTDPYGVVTLLGLTRQKLFFIKPLP